jgi:hypothetical protein
MCDVLVKDEIVCDVLFRNVWEYSSIITIIITIIMMMNVWII